MHELKVGAGKAAIVLPDEFFPSEGFSGIHDDLFTRVLVLENGGKTVVLITIDLTSIGSDLSGQIRQTVADSHGTDPGNIWVSASHTFQAPHLKPDDIEMPEDDANKNRLLKKAVFDAVDSSAGTAFDSLQPGRLGVGTGSCNVNINRDVMTSAGWWKGADPDGISDKTLMVFRFESVDGRPLAFFINYAVQSCVLLDSEPSDGRILVSADLAGAVSAFVENSYGDDLVALWSTGAAGDQDPVFVANRHRVDMNGNYSRSDIGEAGYALLDLLGERLGKEVIRTGNRIGHYSSGALLKTISRRIKLPGQKIFPNVRDMKPSVDYVFEEDDQLEITVNVLIINNTALVGVAPELVSRTGMQLREASPYKNTVVMTMVNGAMKYLPDIVSYDRITYAAMNSRGARGAAEILRDEITGLLNETILLPAH